MPLKLSFKPGEKFVINGAVLINGNRRSQLILQNKASLLREKDIMQEQDANTPARRIYLPIMMMSLDGNGTAVYEAEFTARLEEFEAVISNPDMLGVCRSLRECVASGQHYKALMMCRKLMEYEETLLVCGSEESA